MTNEQQARHLDMPRAPMPPLPPYPPRPVPRVVDMTGLEQSLRSEPSPPRGVMPESLQQLARLISQQPLVPKGAMDASKNMTLIFETVAKDIVKTAQDGLDRANLTFEEAKSYAAVILEAGHVLCERMESDAVRAYQLSVLMTEAQKIFATLAGNSPQPG